MCSLVSTALDRDTDDSASARRRQRPDSALPTVLRAFFRTRLQPDAERAPRVRLLVRRTLVRLARRRAAGPLVEAEPPSSGTRPRKEEVLRAALMELRRLEETRPPRDEAGPLVHRN